MDYYFSKWIDIEKINNKSVGDKIKTVTNLVYARNRKRLTPSKSKQNFCRKLNIDLDLCDTDENNSTTNIQPSDSYVQSNGNFNLTHSNNKQNYCTRSGHN